MTSTHSRESELDQSLRSLQWLAIAGILIFFGSAGIWASTTTFSGAVIATGQFVVENNTKKVQHPYGGVVAQLNVKEGDRVSEGQVLIRLDDTAARVSLNILEHQLEELQTRYHRLLAERDGSTNISTPVALASRLHEEGISELVAAEYLLFAARRAARDGQVSQIEQRIMQLNNEIDGLNAQLASNDEQLVLVELELTAVRNLYEKNLVSLGRKIALERESVSIVGRKGQIISGVAQSRGKIAELRLQIIQIAESFREDVMKNLSETQSRIAELRQKRIDAEDKLRRADIRASVSGVIHQLLFHTLGGVINPSEPIMLIVPEDQPLQVETKVSPADIDQVQQGGRAYVKMHAFNKRRTPELEGEVSFISADASREQSNAPLFYTVRITVPSNQLTRLGRERITPGMTADIFVATEDRTPLEFLLKPLAEQIGKAFRER